MIQAKIETLIRADQQAMRQLELVYELGPDGAFIAAGFVRNRVWDALYEAPVVGQSADVDIVYFDAVDTSAEKDYSFEDSLSAADSVTEWQVRNQARMHHFHGFAPFVSLEDGLMHWAETATSVGVRLNRVRGFEFIAPFGFDDLEDHILRITPAMKQVDPKGFDERLVKKNWLQRWPNLKVVRD